MERSARHFAPGDLEVDTAPGPRLIGLCELPSRDYQVVTSPTAQHWVKQTGQAGAAASAASAIQGSFAARRPAGLRPPQSRSRTQLRDAIAVRIYYRQPVLA